MRIMIAAVLALSWLAFSAPARAQSAAPIVILHTVQGDIILQLDAGRAPVTVCNFLKYVETGRYAGGSFFRTVVAETNANPHPIDVIQAATPTGSDDPGFGPIALERTIDTGLRHLAGTISMARDGSDTATSSFFIAVKDAPSLDFGGGRNPDGQGFAAFGRVIAGMEIVQAIHAAPAVDEQLTAPVIIAAATLAGERPAACRS